MQRKYHENTVADHLYDASLTRTNRLGDQGVVLREDRGHLEVVVRAPGGRRRRNTRDGEYELLDFQPGLCGGPRHVTSRRDSLVYAPYPRRAAHETRAESPGSAFWCAL